MKYLLILFLVQACFAQSLFDYDITQTNGEKLNLKNLDARAFLVVNIATRCGYTGQLEDLEALHKKYNLKGLKIIAIPSNDFGNQSPENNEEIAKFCKLNYGVSFPIAKKQVIIGNEKSNLYKFISGKTGQEVKWNFEKVLFSKEGKFIKNFPSSVAPLDKKLVEAINEVISSS